MLGKAYTGFGLCRGKRGGRGGEGGQVGVSVGPPGAPLLLLSSMRVVGT